MLPGGDVGIVGVIAERFTFGSLKLFTEMAAAGFAAVEGVHAQEFGEFEEVSDAAGLFQGLVELLVGTEDAYIFPEFFAKCGNERESFLEAGFIASHTAIVPDNFAEFAVEGVDGALAAAIEKFFCDGGGVGDGFLHSRGIGGDLCGLGGREIVADGIRNNEVAIGKTLHKGAGAETVGTVIGEIGFTEDEESGDGGHEIVIHPEAAHGVVGGGIDAHGDFVGVLASDALVHFEEVAVALGNFMFAEALDGVGEIEIDAQAGFTDAAPGITFGFRGAGGDIARDEVTETGIPALEIVVAFVFRNRTGRALVAGLFGNPDAAVVAKRFRHEGELGLILASNGDAGGVNLRETRISKESAPLVGAPNGGGVAAFGVGGEIEDVAVTTGGQDDGIAHVNFDFAVVERASDDAASLAVDDDEIEHVHAGIHFDGTQTDLTFEGLIGAEKKLLAGLAAGVEGAGDLRAAKGTIVEETAVLTGEGDALSDALVDDVDADLRETVDVGFAGAEVAAFDGVVEEAENAVAVIVIVLGGIDATLRGDGVCAARAVLIAEALDVVAEFPEAGGGSAAGKSGTDNDDVVLTLVGGIDELEIELVPVPGLLNGARGGVGD